MSLLGTISLAEPVIHGVLKLSFADGYVGVIDLRPFISDGEVFEWMRQRANFPKMAVDPYGHSISWTADDGYAVDFGADTLRRDCERQAATIAAMWTQGR